MNTPAHLIFGLAAFGRPAAPRVTGAALAGGLAPDLSLYVMAGVSIWGLGIDPHRVFGELYFSPLWQGVFAVDNSFVLWGALALLAVATRRPALTAFAGAALLHLAFDFPLHNDDARRHFWPLSDWVFHSPFSYWDRSLHAASVAPLELGASVMLATGLAVRFRGLGMRALIAALVAAELLSSGVWRFVF